MDVSEAVARRRSIRAFLDHPVPRSTVEDLLVRAHRSPSGGNLQPWHVHALTGARLKELLALVAKEGADEVPAYPIYPANLGDPYRTRRFQSGEDLYATLSIPREDKPARLRQLSRNARFFDAPVGLFVLVDKQMGPPQWADLGMFMQTFMLLAVEQGLDSCAQEFWSLYASKVERFLSTPADQMLFCGIALGYRDPEAPINSLETRRAPNEEWCALHGFGE